ncbi:MAG TPA: type II toxin-antitoxin system prevent-host-death family antitoxin [Lamprocystis sp. (in: g-proteobacteria)]|nr:type II toxin-antitoxin system prevent-host-death family antitoxin [Lamprocystis sp. (in: g-proteobacteria)]
MPETVLNLYDAKTLLSELVDRAANGEEIVIATAGRPVAKLVPLSNTHNRRSPGGWQGKVRISDDFDAPLLW